MASTEVAKVSGIKNILWLKKNSFRRYNGFDRGRESKVAIKTFFIKLIMLIGN
jgi:hypothetical protein